MNKHSFLDLIHYFFGQQSEYPTCDLMELYDGYTTAFIDKGSSA